MVGFTISGLGTVTQNLQLQIIEAAPTLATNGTRNTILLKNNAAFAYPTSLTVDGGTGPGSVGGQVQFLDNSSLGSGSAQALNSLNGGSGGEIWFLDNSSASNKGGPSNGQLFALGFSGTGSAQGQIFFMGTSTGSNADIGAEGGKISFLESSNAGDFVVAASSGGSVIFSDTASAGSVQLTAVGLSSGSTLQFLGDSTGGTAQVGFMYPGNETLDISGHNPPGVTIGSLVGLYGIVNLGANTLTVGSNNLTTSYSGLIEGSGSVTKIGTGTLILSGSNTYTGGTTVNGGVLQVTNLAGSGTGTGAVQVDTGTLGGKGMIAGAVTVGTGSGAGAFLEPGIGVIKPSSLSIQSALTFKADSTYTYKLNTNRVKADKAIANGVTIDGGAQFNFVAFANKTLRVGKVFVVISNTAATPISGTFANLPDGSTFTVGHNTFQASYEGGDGNDLTLTVAP